MCHFIAACTALTELVISDTNGQQIVQVQKAAGILYSVFVRRSVSCPSIQNSGGARILNRGNGDGRAKRKVKTSIFRLVKYFSRKC